MRRPAKRVKPGPIAALVVAAIILTGCATSNASQDADPENCLYIVKYEGNMLKWAECDAQPAMARERLTSGHPTP